MNIASDARRSQYSKTDIIRLLRMHRIAATPQRVRIASVLFERDQHISAEQLLARVNTDSGDAHVAKATVYNTLRLFADTGLVREVVVDPNRVFYDSNTSDHHHIYNVDSGALTDVPTGDIRVEGSPDLPAATTLLAVDVILRVTSR